MIRIWKHLHKAKPQGTQAERDLKQKYIGFMNVLFENEHSLDIMTRLEERWYNHYLFSYPYLQGAIENLSESISHAVESVIQLSGGRYAVLRDVFDDLDRKIKAVLSEGLELAQRPVAIPLGQVSRKLADRVGNKMANLGEMGNCCGLSVPIGFATTACAYTSFIEYNNLSEKIAPVLDRLDMNNSRQLLFAEKTIKNLFLAAEVPPELKRGIEEESRRCEEESGRGLYWAVRSSAIGEDLAESSFAGQFATALNIPTEQLTMMYKDVASSKYTARVLAYQQMRNIRDDEITMCVGCIEMIDPLCSGTMYSLNPIDPDGGKMVINAVWGIGELLVGGVMSADTFTLSRESGFPLIRQETAAKDIILSRCPDGGLRQLRIAGERASRPCLNTEQLARLADVGMGIEEHFQGPQDIEWCFDQENKLYVLQARPLRISRKAERLDPSRPIEAGIIAEHLQPICHGIGWGKVLKAASVEEIPDILAPETILVLKHSSPRFVSVLRKVAAVVIEKGNWTDHMASVVREFGVPCVVRAGAISGQLHNGQTITVDADEGIIYQGIVSILRKKAATMQQQTIHAQPTESHRLLARMAEMIFALHLTDPRQDDFAPKSCRTWHDILRFCHETALNEMFSLNERNRLQSAKNVFKVQSNLPFSLYLLDIFGDVVGAHRWEYVLPEYVQSLPFQKLWTGMTDPAVSWSGADHALKAHDFLSAMLRTPMYGDMATDTRSYAVVARDYLNLSLSMGYHYIVLDCYLSEDTFVNYVSLSFKGGAAAMRKRNLRVAFIARLLSHMNFTVTTSNDFLTARLKAETAEELGEKLTVIGRIFGVSRLLDIAMEDEEMVEQCVTRFEMHDYSLGLGIRS